MVSTPSRIQIEGVDLLNTGIARTCFDGMVGAVVDNGNHFVMSPNVDYVLYPPIGVREVKLRKDFRYGDDDPMCGPQPYVASGCHLAAIPCRPLKAHLPLNIMWWLPSKHDFIIDSSNILRGLGQLDPVKLNELRYFVDKMQDRVSRYKDDRNFPNKIQAVIEFSASLNDIFVRLEYLPTTLRQTQFSVALLQRCYLELVGYLDYMYVYRPRMLGQAEPAAEVARTIGAYVSNPLVVQEFVRAGLPVWILKRWNTIVETRIDSVQEPRQPETWAVLEDADPPFKPFFTGPAHDPAKYTAFGRLARASTSSPNPFAVRPSSMALVTDAQSPSTSNLPPSLPSASGPARGGRAHDAREKKKTPCRILTYIADTLSNYLPIDSSVKKSRDGRDKWTDIDSPFLPAAIPVWRDAVAAVDRAPTRLKYATRPSDAGYVFPDPGLFVGVATEDKMATYLRNWVTNRSAIIFRLASMGSTASPIKSQLWRSLLNFGLAAPDPSETVGARRRQEIIELLGDCVHEPGVQIGTSAADIVTWRDTQLQPGALPPRHVVHEILWELYELNFRFEFVALDARASSNVDAVLEDRQRLVRACFPAGHLLAVDFARASEGLGAEHWSDRATYLLAMLRVVKSWVDCPASLREVEAKPAADYTEEEMVGMERELARFYAQSFFNYFARAAIVPHRLPHGPSA
ncbi:hypothetical protein FPV67DRAFT_1403925 [Lyophyllum atratum]|nr:hypothetical protein FPV67DRAFT_1403925 [Lyophyllum atratum]